MNRTRIRPARGSAHAARGDNRRPRHSDDDLALAPGPLPPSTAHIGGLVVPRLERPRTARADALCARHALRAARGGAMTPRRARQESGGLAKEAVGMAAPPARGGGRGALRRGHGRFYIYGGGFRVAPALFDVFAGPDAGALPP